MIFVTNRMDFRISDPTESFKIKHFYDFIGVNFTSVKIVKSFIMISRPSFESMTRYKIVVRWHVQFISCQKYIGRFSPSQNFENRILPGHTKFSLGQLNICWFATRCFSKVYRVNFFFKIPTGSDQIHFI